MHDLQKVLGTFDENLTAVARELNLTAWVEGEEADVVLGVEVLKSLLSLVRAGETVDKSRLAYCVELAREGRCEDISTLLSGVVAITSRGKPVKCKTIGQKAYVAAAKDNEVVFGIGPAGTGKTYLAVCLAVTALKSKQVEKIVLTRPAVEAGEKLGFLPGDLQTKVDPYLRPLYDALQELLGAENFAKYMERGIIEIAPLAYMRGRTLSNAFLILDEAQNTTREQMKMFLTRMGEGSRMMITGDVSQIDLPEGKKSGLVRHTLLRRMSRAYERAEQSAEQRKVIGGNGE